MDAGDYPTAAADLAAFSSYYGLPPANLTVKYSGKKPPVYSDWEAEEALDIEWAHAMAPNAKIILVESVQKKYRSDLGSGHARRETCGKSRRRCGQHELG